MDTLIRRYRQEDLAMKRRKKNLKLPLSIIGAVLMVTLFVTGCVVKQDEPLEATNGSTPEMAQTQQPVADVGKTADVNVPTEINDSSPSLVSYDVVSVGRSDPFMPSQEKAAYDKAKRDAYSEARAYNASIAKAKRMKNVSIREADDISPYSFNLPVPPTSLASPQSFAARITKTKVVGIMYNSKNPTAIINVDEKDYLVRQGDKIIGQEYKVLQINPSWITVGFGSNIYSASIGELFTKDELNKYKNDLYNLKDRFGGRRG